MNIQWLNIYANSDFRHEYETKPQGTGNLGNWRIINYLVTYEHLQILIQVTPIMAAEIVTLVSRFAYSIGGGI
jgi:hypothetical protein